MSDLGVSSLALPTPALEPLLPKPQVLSPSPRVVIMSSILEHMCADVLQQTATQIKFPSTGMDTMPYWNLLPPKRPIKEVLTDIFAKVLEKGWVDSRSIHIFDTLLHMGGVYWFCNNLIKVLGGVGVGQTHGPAGEQVSSDSRRHLRRCLTCFHPLTSQHLTWSAGPLRVSIKCCEKLL